MDLEQVYRPNITFIVVQKCRHIILFCSDHKDQSERLGNTPASTIIDAIEDVYGYPANEIQTYHPCQRYTRGPG